jgi:hypothetical protein
MAHFKINVTGSGDRDQIIDAIKHLYNSLVAADPDEWNEGLEYEDSVLYTDVSEVNDDDELEDIINQ